MFGRDGSFIRPELPRSSVWLQNRFTWLDQEFIEWSACPAVLVDEAADDLFALDPGRGY
jgi:hypothetical protein